MAPTVLLRPADVVCTRGRSLVSRLIRVFTRRVGESRSRVNHVAIVVEGGPLDEAVIVEALSRVRRHRLIPRYGGPRASEVAVFRPLALGAAERAAVVAKAESYVGRKYGRLKLLAHFADWLLQGAYVFRRLAVMDAYPICSWVVAYAFAAAGRGFGRPPAAADPDDIWDYVSTHTDEFAPVLPLAPLAAAGPAAAP